MYHIVSLANNTYSISREANKGYLPFRLPATIAWKVACYLNSK